MKKFGVGLLAALTIFVGANSTHASAVTWNTAYNRAYNLMRSKCSDFWHGCEEPVSWLYCHGPYRGHVQYWCSGGQMRMYLHTFPEFWSYTIGVTPWGHIATWKRQKG